MSKVISMKSVILTFGLILSVTTIFGQKNNREDASSVIVNNQQRTYQHSLGSSLFLVGNMDRNEPPMYFQLNYGFHFAPRSAIVVEAITWAYYRPLGIQYWDTSEDSYPGKIRSFGIGTGYQHFFWKGLYSTIQATPFLQNFYDTNDEKIQSGFQLWCQLRTGYRIDFFKNRLFIEPSIVINYWPVNTDFPESFKQVEKEWPNYFLFEPGLHFGFKF